MGDVAPEQVQWLWHPYIPRGKITIIQGDPGDEGKTTFALALIAALTTGNKLPEQERAMDPANVIFQTAEDGLADTIKPRLVELGADCSRVLVIDESDKELTMADARLEQAIVETGARLLVLDPIQAYLGCGVDDAQGQLPLTFANEVRPVLTGLRQIAERNDCAVLLVGHMNKSQGNRSAYRGLGSIDFQASARSVLIVGRIKDDPTRRAVAHDKSSLAPQGRTIVFSLGEAGFGWQGFCDLTVDELLSAKPLGQSKKLQAMRLIVELTASGPVSSSELEEKAAALGISERTLDAAKQELGAKAVRIGKQWAVTLPEIVPGEGCKGVTS